MTADPQTVIEPGARLGDLTLVRELGRGGQGIVYEARQESLGRSVAVKILPRSKAETSDVQIRFHREAEAAARLDHPNIVPVYGFEETAGHHLILQQLVPGGSLEAWIEQRRSASKRTDASACREAATLCRDIALGIQHAHEHGVIHRDVKPANVLLASDGTPRLTDFGLAKLVDQIGLTETGTVLGTPHYMAPEQVDRSRGPMDELTDVYGLGAVLYRLLTHQPPFPGKSREAVFMDILLRAPRSPRRLQPAVSPDLEAVCLKALEKAPDQRYQSAAAFAEDLDRFLRGASTRARPVGPVGRAVRAMRRLASSSLALVGLLIAVLWLAADEIWLRPLADQDLVPHGVRLVGLVAFALLAIWPLGMLGTRLSRGRPWGRLGAIALVLLLAGLDAGVIFGQRSGQAHARDLAVLQSHLDVERHDVRDVEAHIARWGSSFDAQDEFVVARILLQRNRPDRAREWAQRLESYAGASPVPWVLNMAIDEALGDYAGAAGSEQAFVARSAACRSWSDMLQVGDILSDVGRHAESLAAYEAAARLDAPGALINLKQAGALAQLCREEQARERLAEYHHLRPDPEPAAVLLALSMATRERDWEEAEAQLVQLEADPNVHLLLLVQERHGLLLVQERKDEAFKLLSEVANLHPADAAVQQSCAQLAADSAILPANYAKYFLDTGDPERAAPYVEQATPLLDLAQRLYEQLLAADDANAYAHTGLSAIHVYRALMNSERREGFLDAAVSEAGRAIELDPAFHEAHFNLGLARRYLLELHHGADKQDWPLPEWRAAIASYEASLRLHGLQIIILNDTANQLAHMYKRTSDEARRQAGLGYTERALRILSPRPGSDCVPSSAERTNLSVVYDTRRDLLELGGDWAEALDCARLSMEHLPTTDKVRLKDRQGKVAALEAKLAGDL